MKAQATAEVLPFHDESSAWSATLTENMREGLLAIQREGGEVVHLNSSAARILGLSPNELLGQSVDKVADLLGDDRICTVFRDALGTGGTVEEELYFAPARAWVEVRAVPAAEQVLIYLWQRAVRRSAEQLFAESLERFELIAQTTTDLVWDWNILEGRLWRSEKAADFVDPSVGLNGESHERWFSRILPADQDRVRAEFHALIEGDACRGLLEYSMQRTDGEVVHLVERILVLRDAKGTAVRAVGSIRDVSEQCRLESQLRRAQRLESVGRVAGGIAHDLNNILTPISMALDLLTLDADDHHERQVMESLQKSISHGASLLQILLMFARGSEGEKTLIDPSQVSRDVLQIARETFPGTIRLKENRAPELSAVVGNATQLRQILLNLLMNARDATEGSGTLTVGVRNQQLDAATAEAMGLKPGPHVRFSVEDDGPGIPTEILDKIWDPFFTTKEKGKGTGLGLSTAIAIAQAHLGTIQVSSKPGEGTSFEIFLPASRQLPESERSPNSGLHEPRIQSGKTILLADADASIRVVTQRILLKRGFQVVVPEIGADGQIDVEPRQQEVHLLIIDQALPGAERARLIRSFRKRFRDLPIIATSGHQQQSPVSPGEEKRTGTFLRKPFTGPELIACVERALETSRSDASRPAAS